MHKAETACFVSAALALASCLMCTEPATGKPQAGKPNILFVLSDDLGYGDLGCYGQERILTPNIDRLAAEGMRFTQVYAGSTVCAPSRCVLMTGLHNGHARLRDNLPHGITLKTEDITVAEVLRGAGYRTGAIGKWSLGDHGSQGPAADQEHAAGAEALLPLPADSRKQNLSRIPVAHGVNASIWATRRQPQSELSRGHRQKKLRRGRYRPSVPRLKGAGARQSRRDPSRERRRSRLATDPPVSLAALTAWSLRRRLQNAGDRSSGGSFGAPAAGGRCVIYLQIVHEDLATG